MCGARQMKCFWADHYEIGVYSGDADTAIGRFCGRQRGGLHAYESSKRRRLIWSGPGRFPAGMGEREVVRPRLISPLGLERGGLGPQSGPPALCTSLVAILQAADTVRVLHSRTNASGRFPIALMTRPSRMPFPSPPGEGAPRGGRGGRLLRSTSHRGSLPQESRCPSSGRTGHPLPRGEGTITPAPSRSLLTPITDMTSPNSEKKYAAQRPPGTHPNRTAEDHPAGTPVARAPTGSRWQ